MQNALSISVLFVELHELARSESNRRSSNPNNTRCVGSDGGKMWGFGAAQASCRRTKSHSIFFKVFFKSDR